MSLFNLPFEEIIQVVYHLSTKKQTVLYSIYYLRLVETSSSIEAMIIAHDMIAYMI